MANKNGSALVKWIVILCVLGAIGVAVWFLVARHGNEVAQFQTATVTRGEIVQAVTATGTLNPVLNVQVGSQISGNIQKLYADYNTHVTSNQVVAQLDPSTYQANVLSAQGDLASARANLELNQAQAKRADELFTAKLISGSDHDTAIATLHQAEAQVQMKGAALSNAQVTLQRCTIYAPVDGVVISRAVDVGQTVAASLSAPVLFTIANDLTKMQIDCSVSEADIGTVVETQKVSFTVDAFPNRKFTGRVMQIRNSPTTVQNVVTYDVVVSVNNDDLKLRPGMTANASIIVAQRDDVLKIANAALRFKPVDAMTNIVIAAAGEENKTNVVAGEPPLTGNEPPAELQRRVMAMRDRGEQVPPEIGAKLREYYQNGTLQRTGRGGKGGGSGDVNAVMTRTVYEPVKNADGKAMLQTVRIKTGISDGVTTEVIEGLKEGDKVVTSAVVPNAPAAAPASNPFGGGGMPGGPRRM